MVWKVTYLGYTEKMITALLSSQDFLLLHVVGAKGKVSEDYYRLVNQNNLDYIEIENKTDLLAHHELFDDADIIFMYKFEFIIPQDVVDRHRIINFHGGDIRTNRGAHAVVWSVLLREVCTCLSCYELTGGIDEGILIDAYGVDIEKNDNPIAVNEKLARGLPYLLDAVVKYLSGEKEGVLVKGGMYRRKIEKHDYTIDLCNDPLDVIKAKILSQQPYFGAIVVLDETEHRVKEFKFLSQPVSCEKRDIDITENSVSIVEGADKLVMYLIENQK